MTHSPSQSRIAIRRAEPGDAALIHQLVCELADYERLSHEVVATEAVFRESLFGETPAAECVLALLDGEPVGYALFFHNFSSFTGRRGLYLEDLFVRPPARGHGAGKALLVELARIAGEQKCSRFQWVVLDWNESAIEFYKSLGAEPLNDWVVWRLTGEALERLAENA